METDSLVKFVIASEQHLTQLLPLKETNCPKVEENETFSIEIKKSWMSLIFYYLTQEILMAYYLMQ